MALTRRQKEFLDFLIGFPVAYMIAFRGGRYKNILLFLVIAPFFTQPSVIERLSGGLLVLDDQHLEHGGHVPSCVRVVRLAVADPLLAMIAEDGSDWRTRISPSCTTETARRPSRPT